MRSSAISELPAISCFVASYSAHVYSIVVVFSLIIDWFAFPGRWIKSHIQCYGHIVDCRLETEIHKTFIHLKESIAFLVYGVFELFHS